VEIKVYVLSDLPLMGLHVLDLVARSVLYEYVETWFVVFYSKSW